MRSKFHLVGTLAFIRVMSAALFLFVLFFPHIDLQNKQTVNSYTIYMNGVLIGSTCSKDDFYDNYRLARLQLAANQNNLTLMEYPDVEIVDEKVVNMIPDSSETMVANMLGVLNSQQAKTLTPAYSIKVNDMLVNVAGAENVRTLFEDTVQMYDTEHVFGVELVQDNSREFNILTPVIKEKTESSAEESQSVMLAGGLEQLWDSADYNYEPEKTGFDYYELGIKEAHFSADIEIVSAYLPEDELIDAKTAREKLTTNQDTTQIYKVKSGDTLSEISLQVGMPLEQIIALNDELEDENSNIYVDQELLITQPEPQLAVIWTTQEKVCESYDLEIQYIYNDEWYTNKSVTRQQPSAGYREAVANITYQNDSRIGQEILYEEVMEEAVAKVIEVGTLVPPTYIKPIAGGRLTSNFGPRKAPTKGASTYHKGVDWATPVGTAVYASSGGVVAKAGWGSGYGYVIYINHPDGKQTRYGHLSKVKVSVGQTVKQGQVIAASGNTGRSTGPHIHFEILSGGTQVNPFKYLN